MKAKFIKEVPPKPDFTPFSINIKFETYAEARALHMLCNHTDILRANHIKGNIDDQEIRRALSDGAPDLNYYGGLWAEFHDSVKRCINKRWGHRDA